MYKVVVTKLAEQDLDRITLYILERLENPKAANDFLNAVYKIEENLQLVEILRFFHGTQDYLHLI